MQTKPPAGLFAERFARAREAWPRLAVDEDGFARHLERHGWTAGPAPHEADLYLAFACATGEPRALEAFDARHLAQVPSFIAGLREQEAFADEVRQRLRERLLMGGAEGKPKLFDYSGRGALGGWVRVAAMRQALDLIESERAHRPSEDSEEDLLAATVDPELAAIRKRHLPQLREAFLAALAALDGAERNLLRFYLVEGLNLERIGRLLGLSRASVGRRVVECREKLLEQTRARLSELSGTSSAEVGSLIRILQSQLDVSIRGFLLRDQR